MSRRPGRTTLALAVAMVAFVMWLFWLGDLLAMRVWAQGPDDRGINRLAVE